MKVFVGMSGGVDSSLTAALLKEQGHDVTGVYMKNWTEDLPGMRCPWADDLADAKRVAVQLGIDLKVYDFENEYKQKVVDYMVEEYKAGRTPNPDIMCNQEVKFKLFLEAALEDGAEMIATGHYARVEHGSGVSHESQTQVSSSREAESRNSLHSMELAALRQPPNGQEFRDSASGSVDGASAFSRATLLQAKDKNKDQTYFLYRVTGEALQKTFFPLGEFTKPEVREMAKERGLYTAGKKDSQGICFVGQIGVKDFLSQYVETVPGDVIDKQTGQKVGRHEGAIFYTVGKDMEKNEVYVTRDLNDDTLWKKQISLTSLHWINPPAAGQADNDVQVRVRHRAPLTPGKLTFCSRSDLEQGGGGGVGAVVELSESQRAITAGQSVVIYDGDVCLGGGIVA